MAAQKIGTSMRQALESPVQIEIQAGGVKDVDALKLFQEDLRSIPRVKEVELRSYSGGEAALTVWMEGIKGEELAASLVREKSRSLELKRVEPYHIELEFRAQ